MSTYARSRVASAAAVLVLAASLAAGALAGWQVGSRLAGRWEA